MSEKKVIDPNHAWRMLGPISAPERECGCHVTPEHLQLCEYGAYLKGCVEGWFDAYMDGVVGAHTHYEWYRHYLKEYMQHIGAS
jgi:hypothetical protein